SSLLSLTAPPPPPLYTLSLHDALPICTSGGSGAAPPRLRGDRARAAQRGPHRLHGDGQDFGGPDRRGPPRPSFRGHRRADRGAEIGRASCRERVEVWGGDGV